MSEDKAEELFPQEVSEQPAPEAPKEPEPVPEAPKDPEPTPQPAPPAEAPPQAAERPEHTVPLPKYLDTRDENKELKRRLAELEARQKQPQAPDPVDDPDGYARHHEQRFEQKLTAQKFEMSDVMARQAHGSEVVETAMNWAMERAQTDPVFAASYMREAHPIDWIVRQHKRDALFSQLPDDTSSLEELIQREVAKRLQSAVPAAPAMPVQAGAGIQSAGKPPLPPRSQASDVAVSADATAGDPRAEFLAIFDRK